MDVTGGVTVGHNGSPTPGPGPSSMPFSGAAASGVPGLGSAPTSALDSPAPGPGPGPEPIPGPIPSPDESEGDPNATVDYDGRRLTPQQASQELARTRAQAAAADRNRTEMERRARQAIETAHQLSGVLRTYGLLDESGQYLVEAPEQVRARLAQAQGRHLDPAEPEIPTFEASVPRVLGGPVIEGKPMGREFWSYVKDQAEEKGLDVGFGLVADHVDQVIGSLHKYYSEVLIPEMLRSRLSRFSPYFDQLEQVQSEASFLSEMQGAADSQGRLLYPELRDPRHVTNLITVMKQLQDSGAPGEFVYSPKGFSYAVQIYRYNAGRVRAGQPAVRVGSPGLPAVPQQPGARGNPMAGRVPGPGFAPARPRSAAPPVATVMSNTPGVPRPRVGGSSGVADATRANLLKDSRIGGIDFGL